jgi:hypothetical protein
MGPYLLNDMCKSCGNCSKEHNSNIDDNMDAVLDNPIL